MNAKVVRQRLSPYICRCCAANDFRASMQAFLAFFVRFNALFVFLLLEGAAFWLVVHRNDKQKHVFLSSTNRLVGNLHQFYDGTVGYFGLKRQNDSLHVMNAQLRGQSLAGGHYTIGYQLDTALQKLDSANVVSYVYTAGEVVNNTTGRFNNYLTIDKGRLQGITADMGVLSGEGRGIVGIVRRVSNHYALVMSVLHQQTRISARLKRTSFFGTLTWNGFSPRLMQLEAIPKHADIKKGDVVETSGYSSIFPPNVPVGVVDTCYVEQGSNFFSIEVSLFCDLSKVRYVHLVNNLMRQEKEALEKSEADD